MAKARVTGTADVLRAMQTYQIRYQAQCLGVLEQGAETVKDRMKAEHRWQNQTGAAEANLDCQVFDKAGPALRLVAFHGVSYGRFLETTQQGRFAVLLPTMRSEWPRILAQLRTRLRDLRKGAGDA